MKSRTYGNFVLKDPYCTAGQNFRTALTFTGMNVLAFQQFRFIKPQLWHFNHFLNKYHICRNMRGVLEELHHNTMMNPMLLHCTLSCMVGSLYVYVYFSSNSKGIYSQWTK